MPNPGHNQMGETWEDCNRCGFPFPSSQMTTQKGMRVCTRTCRDVLDVELRDRVIAAVLEDDSEGKNEVASQTTSDGEELSF